MCWVRSVGEVRDEILFALFGALGGLDQAVGYTGHGGDDSDYGALGGGVLDDRGGAADAVGVADGGATEFHDLEREGHLRLGIFIFAWADGF